MTKKITKKPAAKKAVPSKSTKKSVKPTAKQPSFVTINKIYKDWQETLKSCAKDEINPKSIKNKDKVTSKLLKEIQKLQKQGK